jgi:predicted amidophosphoribosyltransferase
MKNLFSQCIKSVSNVLFPPFCLACGEELALDFSSLCETCFHSLVLLDYEGRCHRCFCPKEQKVCKNCRNLPSGLEGQAACFESSAVTSALFSELKQGRKLSAFSSYMMLQIDALKWPLPDIIVPTGGDAFDDGWGIRKNIAKELSALMQKPYSPCMKLQRHKSTCIYAPLESQLPSSDESILSCTEDVMNKNILLVHDEYRTGTATILSAKKALAEGALSIYSISFTANTVSPLIP